MGLRGPWIAFLAVAVLAMPHARADSLFDDLIQQNGGRIPNPYTDFSKMLYQRASETSKVSGGVSNPQAISLLVPEGRSAQKSYTDFKDPRVISVINTPGGQLYSGYSKKADQMEVISWNPATQQFDFQVITGYSTGSPKVRQASGNECAKCHQNGGPIFPPFPWNEMEGAALAAKMQKEVGGASYMGVGIKDPNDPVQDTGALNFEALVKKSAESRQNAQMCRALCDGNDAAAVDCRRKLLFLALDPQRGAALTEAEGKRANALRAAAISDLRARVTALIKKNDFAYPNPLIPDRDPFQRNVPADQRKDQDPLQKRANVGGMQADVVLRSLNDPTTVRQCLGMDNREARALARFDTPSVLKASKSAELAPLMKSWPLDRYRTTRQLIASLDTDKSGTGFTAYCKEFSLSSGAPLGVPLLKAIDDTVKTANSSPYPSQAHFKKYCAACHDRFNADNLDDMKKYPGGLAQTRLRRFIDLKQFEEARKKDPSLKPPPGPDPMPPSSMPQPTDAEREQMINDVGAK